VVHNGAILCWVCKRDGTDECCFGSAATDCQLWVRWVARAHFFRSCAAARRLARGQKGGREPVCSSQCCAPQPMEPCGELHRPLQVVRMHAGSVVRKWVLCIRVCRLCCTRRGGEPRVQRSRAPRVAPPFQNTRHSVGVLPVCSSFGVNRGSSTCEVCAWGGLSAAGISTQCDASRMSGEPKLHAHARLGGVGSPRSTAP
jgi:hypothetical protein